MTRVLTPEQRAAKQARDRARRAEQKAAKAAPVAAPARPKGATFPTVAAAVRAKAKATRKPVAPERATTYGEVLRMGSFRATDAQHAKLRKLGGSQWIRDKIDAAKG